jgi:hypothetical protein
MEEGEGDPLENAFMSIELPINYVGHPDLPLQDLEDVPEMQHVMRDALKRGLQKPPIMTNPEYAEDISGKIDFNLTGMKNQHLILDGIRNPGKYEQETNAQAYRRLWFEVLNIRPSKQELMVAQYSGMTFDPRLNRMIEEDSSNIFSAKTSTMNDLLRKSFAEFSKERALAGQVVGDQEFKVMNQSTRRKLMDIISLAKNGPALTQALKDAVTSIGADDFAFGQFLSGAADIIGGMFTSGIQGVELVNALAQMYQSQGGAFARLTRFDPSAGLRPEQSSQLG